MEEKNMLNYIKNVIENLPADWLNLTTHRLDIYDEALAKTQFLNQFEMLFSEDNAESSALNQLPTAFDYIRLGHPLSCLLEWVLAKLNRREPKSVVSFSSRTAPVLAILRKNLLANKETQICYSGELPEFLNPEIVRSIYGYQFELKKINQEAALPAFNGTTVLFLQENEIETASIDPAVDFIITTYGELGSVVIVTNDQNDSYIEEIQHVRRRETIAMTPANCFSLLKLLADNSPIQHQISNADSNKKIVVDSIKTVNAVDTMPLVGSSGLSIQYAIMMGLVHDALEMHEGKDIKFIVPPNCYGGTNDQARRVAACVKNVEIVDLPVDGDHDMVKSIDLVLDKIAKEDAIPFIIAEIPTNPRVEVPDLIKLKATLSVQRKTETGAIATDPVFILDQTFCPNVHFLGQDEILSSVRAISYASGSKFPSGGKCTAGYCIANTKAEALMKKIELHLALCDNEATPLQYEILAKQLPSMNQRIRDAYRHTRAFVDFIKETLPEAKINFVSEELADQGFTPSVFSLDLPTKGASEEEREAYKRALNLKLINSMIEEIPLENKYCVSYGQLKGCYWTIPATSTQGTTKEGDKDYIARVALSPEMDLELHKKVFASFASAI